MPAASRSIRSPRHAIAPAVGAVEPEHGPCDRRLAAAAFADEAERLALGDREAHVIDGVHHAAPATEEAAAHRVVLGEVRHGEQRHGGVGITHAWPPRDRLPSTPRSAPPPSPRAAAIRCGNRAVVKPHRGANAQPTIGSERDGTVPAISASRLRLRLELDIRVPDSAKLRNRIEQASRIGMPGSREQVGHRCFLDLATRIHDDHALGHLGDHAEIVRDEHDRRAGLLLQFAHQVEDLRLDRHIERGGRLVGNQQARLAGERHRDHHALAHAARKLMRILRRTALRRRDPDFFQQSRSNAPAPLRSTSRDAGRAPPRSAGRSSARD